MTRDRHTGLNTYQIRTLDSLWVVNVDVARGHVMLGADREHAVTWLRTPEKVGEWLATVQKLLPSVALRVERAR